MVWVHPRRSFRNYCACFSSRFQAKGMDIGVADESLNGIPYEESSESEDEAETEETEGKDNKKHKY